MTRDEIEARDKAFEARMQASEARMTAALSDIKAGFQASFHDLSSKLQNLDATVSMRLQAFDAAISTRLQSSDADTSSRFQAIDAKLASLPSRWSMIGTVVGTGFAVFGAVLAVLAFGGDRFDAGIGLGRDLSETKQAIAALAAENSRQTEQIDRLAGNIQRLVEASARSGQMPQGAPRP